MYGFALKLIVSINYIRSSHFVNSLPSYPIRLPLSFSIIHRMQIIICIYIIQNLPVKPTTKFSTLFLSIYSLPKRTN